MRATIALLMMLGMCACGKADIPTDPGRVDQPPPALAASAVPASITTFAMTGQLIQDTYHYWPTLIINAGGTAITLKHISFALPGATLTSNGSKMDWTVGAGHVFDFSTAHAGTEVLGSGPATSATVTIDYTGVDGQTHELTGTTSIDHIESTATPSALQISNFVLTRWQGPNEWDYWPRFTVTETSGAVDVTITRIEFMLLDMGINGRVPPSFGSWKVPAGGSIRLFDEWSYGEPALYLSSSGLTDRAMVTLSYVDTTGRPGDVTATAQVSADGLPPAPK
jgi:hypothetical protein